MRSAFFAGLWILILCTFFYCSKKKDAPFVNGAIAPKASDLRDRWVGLYTVSTTYTTTDSDLKCYKIADTLWEWRFDTSNAQPWDTGREFEDTLVMKISAPSFQGDVCVWPGPFGTGTLVSTICVDTSGNGSFGGGVRVFQFFTDSFYYSSMAFFGRRMLAQEHRGIRKK